MWRLFRQGTLTEVEGSVQMTSFVKTSLDQLIFKLKKYFLPLLKKQATSMNSLTVLRLPLQDVFPHPCFGLEKIY